MYHNKSSICGGKPWLLLWLLPYLLLSLFEGGAHNHGLFGSPVHVVGHASTHRAPGWEQVARSAEPPSVVALGECLACQWAATAVALMPARGSLLAPGSVALLSPPQAAALSRRALLGRTIRGPPLSEVA